jgi:hypothetical protein
MFSTFTISVQERVGSFTAAPWLRRSDAVVAGGAGKCGGLAGQSRWRARIHRRLATLLAGASLVLAGAGALRAADGTGLMPYATTNSMTATNKPVTVGTNGWEQLGTNAWAVKAGAKIWLAFLNTENLELSKYFRIEIDATNFADIKHLEDGFRGGVGINGSGKAVKTSLLRGIGANSYNGESKPGWMFVDFTFTPQPAWEVISFINLNPHDIHITVQAWSLCGTNCPSSAKELKMTNATFGATGPGVMQTNQQIRQVWIFPKTVPVNTGVPPQFWAHPSTGSWTPQFLPVDPYGVQHPLGGVKWATSGLGLAPDQAFALSFEMQGQQADWFYTMYAFDATTGQYQEYNLNLLPDLSIRADINGVALQFDSAAGMIHKLETSEDFSNWQPFQSLMGTGQPVTIPCATTSPQQFFRFQPLP